MKKKKQRRWLELGKDHDAVVETWKKHATEHDDENFTFLRSMKFKDYGFEPDVMAAELHQQAFQIVDCTRCANCCKRCTIVFNEEDINRIATALDMSVGALIEKYLEPKTAYGHVEEGFYVARQKPCPFLGEDNLCQIYDIRPDVCRGYPYTDQEGLVFRTHGIAGSALTCPAVFWIVERMKQEARG